ncbi:hypothetical protein D3C80_930780 [compost metagenome]
MGPLRGPFATQGRSHKYATFRREDDLDCPQEAGHQSNPGEQPKYATLRREEDLWGALCRDRAAQQPQDQAGRLDLVEQA